MNYNLENVDSVSYASGNLVESFAQLGREKFFYHPNMLREDIFIITARIFASRIKTLKSGTLKVYPNMISVFSAPPDFLHKGEHMDLQDEIVKRVYETNLPKVPYEDNGKTLWRDINYGEFDLHGTSTGIADEINGQRPGGEREHPPYDVVHFRDDEATDVFDGVDGKYHGLFQILNKLRDRIPGNVPLTGGIRHLPETRGMTLIAAVHSGETSKTMHTSGNLRRTNLISIPYNEIIDDSQGLRNEVLQTYEGWKQALTKHLVWLNGSFLETEISFTWNKEVEDALVEIRGKAVSDVRVQGNRYTYDPEDRVYFLMLYGMYSSLLNKHVVNDEGVFEITLSDLQYAQFYLKQLQAGYRKEVKEMLPDDMQSIYETVIEVITEEYAKNHKGVSQTEVSTSPKIPITGKILQKTGKTRKEILRKIYAQALQYDDIKAIGTDSKNNKIKTLYFPSSVSDEEIEEMYPNSQPIF